MRSSSLVPASLLAAALSLVSANAELIDVAPLGSASQTSEWNGGQYPAALAIDGDPSTFSHTDGPTVDNAWTLRFDQENRVGRVELVMRTDCCGGRLTGATVRLFDGEGDSVYDQRISDPGPGNVAAFEIPAGTVARSLRVGFENGVTNPSGASHWIHLGEVRVFAEIDLLPNITRFQAEPDTISSGQSALLSWRVEGAEAVQLIGVGPVEFSGSHEVRSAASEAFTLLASNQHGSSSRSLAVTVDGALLPPRLTEFMANNDGALTRSDGATPDWIELWNPNPVAIDLGGYQLTDDPQDPGRYTISNLILGPGEYFVIDAATESRDGVLATGFKLDRAADSYLALLDPSGRILQSFHYPRQRSNISFGPDWDGEDIHFLKPTPGGPREEGTVSGFVSDTEFSIDRGFYDEPQSISISSATPGAAIYFTTDGSEPSPDNDGAQLYTEPVVVAQSTVLRAAAFRDGYLPTDVDTQTYLFLDDIANQRSRPVGWPSAWVPNLSGVQAPVPAFSHYSVNPRVVRALPLLDRAGESFSMRDALLAIPSMSLVMDVDELLDPRDGLHVNARNRGRAWERRASIEFIDPSTGEAVQANCGIRMHGGWNRYPEMLKKTFRLYFRSEYGDDKLRLPLFPDSITDEFDRILLRSGNGKAWPSPWRPLAGPGNSLERNTYLRDQFVRDLQAEMGQDHVAGRFVHLYVNGLYWGLYNPVERPDEHFASSHLGGEDEDYDVIKWVRGTGHQIASGSDEGWNELIAMVRRGPNTLSDFEEIATRLDLPNFADYMLLNFYAGNVDWVDSNVYALRNRAVNGPFTFYCWDSEETFLSPNRDSTEQRVSDTSTEIHHALRNNLEYRVLFADRAQKHFFNGGALTPAPADAALMRRAWEIDRAIVGDSARWGDLLRPSDPYDRTDWLAEVENLRRNYLRSRPETTLAQLQADGLFPATGAPLFSPQRGGLVNPGTPVTLSANDDPRARIYYTTDGSDPRLPGGEASPSATLFAGATPILIRADTLVRTRTLAGREWSALDEALFLVGDRADDVVVSEIMYHPAAPLPGEAEFIELINRGATTHDLRDLRLTDGIQFDFARSAIHELAPGERIVLVRDPAAFEAAYPGIAFAGVFEGALGNGGDSFSLQQVDGTILWTVSYDDAAPWPGGTDGDGYSLTFRGAEANAATSWRPSAQLGGTPGSTDAVPFDGGDRLLDYALTGVSVQLSAEGVPEFHLTTRLGADDAVVTAEWSTDLQSWSNEGIERTRQVPIGDGLADDVWRLSDPPPDSQLFFRAVVSLR